MNNTPLYAIGDRPLGTTNMGAVQYGTSCGHKSSVSLLPPQYSGAAWDNFTPWDTTAEKEAKELAKQEQDEAYQEALLGIGSSVTPPKPISNVALAIVALFAVGGIYALSRS